jgi:nucleotidyltransferase substrate binding protein (TIGR01987 family)
MILDLTSLRQATNALQKSLNSCLKNKHNASLSSDDLETLKAGVIQNFEITYELCWKFMKRRLELNTPDLELNGLPRKELFRKAQESRLIGEAAKWFEYHNARNETTHTYNSDKAEIVYNLADQFLQDALNLLRNLE